jgi:hypothetical protein
MARVYRPNGSKRWVIEFTAPDGRRKGVIGPEDRTEAEALARRLTACPIEDDSRPDIVVEN